MRHLHIDIETYSSVDLPKSGLYKYAESPDFEIMLIAYSLEGAPVQVIDLACGEFMPNELIEALHAGDVLIYAHNAAFERVCFRAIGINIPAHRWYCTAVHAAYCGLPLSLGDVSKALGLGAAAKDPKGKALIKFFSVPVAPTKRNGFRSRNLPHHDPEKWGAYKAYNAQDVRAEMALMERLKDYKLTKFERKLYAVDQQINDNGVLVDMDLVNAAISIDRKNAISLFDRMRKLSGVDNPNSAAQLKAWIGDTTGENISSLAKGEIDRLIGLVGAGAASDVLELRKEAAKTSTKKYTAMEQVAGADGRIRGLFQLYGAGRTGRWAGRLVQLQNLPRNYIKELDQARQTVLTGDYELCSLYFDSVSDTLSQLIRTALVAGEGYTFAVADFSAIEARVIAWLAGEKWRLEVFKTHGKIYEASASMMFGVPIESVTKGSDLRMKGKVAELALGYQGGVGALKTMGGESMGLSEDEMASIVSKWRAANPAIVALWADVEKKAMLAMRNQGQYFMSPGLEFIYNGESLSIYLPSGRRLIYWQPKLAKNRFDRNAITYRGTETQTKQWGWIETYGGKLVENIVQAIARDLMAHTLVGLSETLPDGMSINMHIHDEVVCRVPAGSEAMPLIERVMSTPPDWAASLPLAADGYYTDYYKKD